MDSAVSPFAVNNATYIRRRNKVALPDGPVSGRDATVTTPLLAAALKNLESLGYTFSPALINGCRSLPHGRFVRFYKDILPTLQELRGADRRFEPMYPNFPQQVMAASESELYLNAILHYGSDGKLRPATKQEKRHPLRENTDLTALDLGDAEDFTRLFGQIVSSNTALSDQDKQDLRWFVTNDKEQLAYLLPDTIPQKETVAFIGALIIELSSREQAVAYLEKYTKTATDVLRIAVARSDGDVSLAAPTKFRTFARNERVALLTLLERVGENATEDMLRWKSRWVRLGEKLHPGEYRTRFPRAAKSFDILRNDTPFRTFNARLEGELAAKEVNAAVQQLASRPGDFARRLDHLLRLSPESADAILDAFAPLTPRVSTLVLLQVRQHFATRNAGHELRVFFPKGQLAKAHAEPNTLPPLSDAVCDRATAVCERALTERFAKLPPLGGVYIDPSLRDYMAPFALRSASKSLRTLVRGSRLPLPAGNTLRFFVWWRNGKDRTDIDLSATLFDANFRYLDVLSYYNLKNFGGVHSGDIVNAPEGASEFIDVAKDKLREAKVRYIVMSLHSYTQQPYKDLPECFAGWMVRQQAGSGEIFEPRTVQDRLDVTADTRVALPLIIDLTEDRVIWCDMALRFHPKWNNNAMENLSGIQLTLQSLTQRQKPNLYDLFRLHALARGRQVDSESEADTVFAVSIGTPFQLERIASEFMA